MALLASMLAGTDTVHRHAPVGASAQAAAPAAAMPTIEIDFRLTASATDIGSTGTSGSATIDASASTVGVADSNIWSLNAAGVDQDLSEMQSIGVTSVRLPIPWTFIEPQNGTYDWSQMDMIINAAQARGMSIVGTITGNPSWDGKAGVGQPNAQAYAGFAAAVASRYSTQISAFEIWNEENSQGFFASSQAAAAYTAVLKAAYTAIKAVDPTATVIAGGLASVANIPGINESPENFLSKILADGAAGYFDAIAYHPYNLETQLSAGAGLAESPLNQLNALRADLNSYGLNGIQIWATEYGEPTTPGLATTAQQAAYIQNFVVEWQALSKTLNLGPAYLYTVRDSASGALNDENNYGLFYSDGTPKPAALVVAQLEYDLKNNLPLPSLDSTIYTLTPGQQVAVALSEVIQWMRLPLTTTVEGLASLVAGAALSTVEALPPVNAALSALAAVLNAVGEVAPVKAAVAAVTAVIHALGTATNLIESAVTAAAVNTVINSVNAVVSTTQAVGPAVQAAARALAAAAHNTELTVAAAINGTQATMAAAARGNQLPASPPAKTAATAKLVSATAASAVTSSAVANSATANSAVATSATANSAASSADTTPARPAATGKGTEKGDKDKGDKGNEAKSASAAPTAAQTTGKHRRDDGHRGSSDGPGRHRK
ncbi:MAG: cellulase family glycosylhydrolase [Mycobacterium sp.]